MGIVFIVGMPSLYCIDSHNIAQSIAMSVIVYICIKQEKR